MPDIKKPPLSNYIASTGYNFTRSHDVFSLQYEVTIFLQCKGKGHSATCMDRHRRQAEVCGSKLLTRPAPTTLPPANIRWVGPRSGLDGTENFVGTGIRSPDRPARSELPYRLSYPGRFTYNIDRLKSRIKIPTKVTKYSSLYLFCKTRTKLTI